MENSIVFTVIIPCYNSEAYVKNALDSVVNQTYPNWKIIAVNDGSTDNTLSILNEYKEKYSQIQVLSKPNGGYATAINYALDFVSGGGYFLMLGSDDTLDVNLFSGIVSNIGENEPDMIAFKTIKLIGNERELDVSTRFDKKIEEYNTDIATFSFKYEQYSELFSIRDTSRCYKTQLLGDLRYFGTTGMASDSFFSRLFTHKCSSFMVLPVEAYYWKVRKDSVSADINLNKYIDMLSNWTEYFKALTDGDFTSLTLFEIKEFTNIYYFELEFAGKLKLKLIKYSKLIKNLFKAELKCIKKYDLKIEVEKQIKLTSRFPFLSLVFSKIKSVFK